MIFDLPGRESLQRVPDHRPAARQQGARRRAARPLRHRRGARSPRSPAETARRGTAVGPRVGPGVDRVEAWHRSRSSRASRRRPRRSTEVAPESDVAERKEALDDDVDAILDEIDDVLETNAEDFVKSFIQKGGE